MEVSKKRRKVKSSDSFDSDSSSIEKRMEVTDSVIWLIRMSKIHIVDTLMDLALLEMIPVHIIIGRGHGGMIVSQCIQVLWEKTTLMHHQVRRVHAILNFRGL